MVEWFCQKLASSHSLRRLSLGSQPAVKSMISDGCRRKSYEALGGTRNLTCIQLGYSDNVGRNQTQRVLLINLILVLSGLISGSIPFADVEAPAAAARAISTGDRPFPNSGALFKDQPAWGLLNGCLAIEPTERPTIQALSFEARPEIPRIRTLLSSYHVVWSLPDCDVGLFGQHRTSHRHLSAGR